MTRTSKKTSKSIFRSIFHLLFLLLGLIPLVMWFFLDLFKGDEDISLKKGKTNPAKSKDKRVVKNRSKLSKGFVKKEIGNQSIVVEKKSNKSVKDKTSDGSLAKNLRQQRILSLIGRKGEVAMSDVKSLFPGVNVRTVRRDLDLLVKKGVIVKEGTTRSTIYKSKS